MTRLLLFALALLTPGLAWGQPALVLPGGCGTASYTGSMQPQTQDTTGRGCVSSAPAALTLITLDIKQVTTGGTAVNALSAGHRTKGGWLQNPVGAAQPLCINEIGTASGTTSSGDTTCIAAGQTYTISPGTGAVSVVSSDSSHAFSGMGFN